MEQCTEAEKQAFLAIYAWAEAVRAYANGDMEKFLEEMALCEEHREAIKAGEADP